MKLKIGLKSGKHIIMKKVTTSMLNTLLRDYGTATIFFNGKIGEYDKGVTMIIKDNIEYIKILKR